MNNCKFCKLRIAQRSNYQWYHVSTEDARCPLVATPEPTTATGNWQNREVAKPN